MLYAADIVGFPGMRGREGEHRLQRRDIPDRDEVEKPVGHVAVRRELVAAALVAAVVKRGK